MLVDSTLYLAIRQVSDDAVANLEFSYRTHHFAVLGQQTVAHPIDALGIAGCEALLQQFDPMATNQHLPFCRLRQPHSKRLDASGLFVHSMNEPFGYCRRCFERLMRHKIEDAHISCVTDATQDRQRELRTNGTERVAVETTQVGGCTAAADDDHGIELVVGLLSLESC